MVYMLFDNPADKKNMNFLKDYDETASFEMVFPREQCKFIKSMVRACKNCIDDSSKGDTIICWYDFMGIICWWLCKFLNKKRKIVALNILLKNKKSIKNKVARLLYKGALSSGNLKATVTSREYGRSINALLGTRKQFILLHDIYHGGYEIEYDGVVQKNSVFCGGRNGRDWAFLLKLSKEMLDIQFNVVLPQDVYEQYKNLFGENVNVKSEIPEQEFLMFMCQSSLVLMPLDTEAPAGLIAMFQAAANGKMIITSDTVTTREYFSDRRGCLCNKTTDDWKSQIRFWLGHQDEATECARRLTAFLESECSEKKYAEILGQIANGGATK